jgi:predicted esterase
MENARRLFLILVIALAAALAACSDDTAGSDGGAGTDAGKADAALPDLPGPDAPTYCKPAGSGLQDITGTPAGPYFVHHPATPASTTPTVLFLPGGSGSNAVATLTYNLWLSGGKKLDQFRVVVPYAADGNFADEVQRSIKVLDEVLACYGGDRSKVHLAGTSNGGVQAYGLMLTEYARFKTLLGAPGLFTSNPSDSALKTALTGRAVYNGVGEIDSTWKSSVSPTHTRLKNLGLDSTYVEFKGQDHILTAAFDESVFFDFWAKH